MKINKINDNLFLSTRFKLDFIAGIFCFFVLFGFSFIVYKLLTQDIIYQISPIFKYLEKSDNNLNSEIFFADLQRQTLFLLVVCDIIIFIVSLFLFDRMVKKMLEPIEFVSNIQKRFASNVSHELRTPLSIMTMRGEILMSKIEKESDREKSIETEKFITETKDGVGVILKEVGLMTNIIDDLLFESRIKYVENKVEIIRIEDILGMIDDIYSRMGILKKDSVDFLVENSLNVDESILANKLHIERIFSNLLSNAFKYTNIGEVKVVISKRRNIGRKSMSIKIVDTGIGISKQELPKISERFYRSKEVEEEISGTGLGLSIVRGIVNSNGWSFDIKSVKDAGTTVEISRILLR